jgi:prepilin-type N-terminal cleavage/methylation domain-containing protein
MRTRNALRSPRGDGFTLVELLLAVTLLAGLIGAVSFGFSSLRRNAQLDEGVERVETALRFARAHAASTGHKVQVVLAPTPPTADASGMAASSSTDRNAGSQANSSNVGASSTDSPWLPLRIEWEADPVRAPGVFEPIASLSGEMSDVTDLVEVRSVEKESADTRPSANQDDPSASFPVAGNVAAGANALADESSASAGQAAGSLDPASDPMKPSAITFYPDGSCDGGTIVLASRDAEDVREVAVRVQGVTGTTRREWRDSAAASGTLSGASGTQSGRADAVNPAPSPASATAPQRRP